ncbi:MAG: gliding motility-associated protein GldE [Flavobacteriales bacterium]|nr:gliding motility-associated protein GldE [Flavobacteriales bacterium]
MEGDPEQIFNSLFLLKQVFVSVALLPKISIAFVVLVLVFLSALVSGSENAFFSLSPGDVADLEEKNSGGSKFALKLINHPDRVSATRNLLATILIMNNFINISIIVLMTLLFKDLWPLLHLAEWLQFTLEVVFITFLLVLFGEIIPKIYATQNNLSLVNFTSPFIFYSQKFLQPFVWLLAKSTVAIDKRLAKKQSNVSLEELNQAIDIASVDDNIEEKNILKGLVNYGNISVKQIMKPRMDVSAVDIETEQQELIDLIKEWGYSRVPVYEGSFDKIVGVLYIKDLLPVLTNKSKKKWQSFMRDPFFVPAFKKIDDLLEEFQEKRIHMAIVVDEYGGSLGIVTMEDILEEIFGDIRDEFDEDELVYSKLDDHNYIFEGKAMLTDISKIFELSSDYFDDARGEADTLAGMLMEIHQGIPKRGDLIEFEEFTFLVESADRRRVKRVKVSRQTTETT